MAASRHIQTLPLEASHLALTDVTFIQKSLRKFEENIPTVFQLYAEEGIYVSAVPLWDLATGKLTEAITDFLTRKNVPLLMDLNPIALGVALDTSLKNLSICGEIENGSQ